MTNNNRVNLFERTTVVANMDLKYFIVKFSRCLNTEDIQLTLSYLLQH